MVSEWFFVIIWRLCVFFISIQFIQWFILLLLLVIRVGHSNQATKIWANQEMDVTTDAEDIENKY